MSGECQRGPSCDQPVNAVTCAAYPRGSECFANIDDLTKKGLREFQPYWVTDNWLRKGCRADKAWEFDDLNCFGVSALRRLGDLGVLIDLSHMGPEPFQEAMDSIGPNRPFIISHTGVAQPSLCKKWKDYKSVRNECRAFATWNNLKPVKPATNAQDSIDDALAISMLNQGAMPGATFLLSDAVVQKVRDRNGVIALHFMSSLICERCGATEVTVSNLVDEIDYFKRKDWMESVALGPDFLPQKGILMAGGLRDMTELKNVAIEMKVRKYPDQDIENVLGLDLLRLYCRVWPPSPPSSPADIKCKDLVDHRAGNATTFVAQPR